ncbi:MAG: radical SAM protein [Bacteroidia bacterium]|nr:radical SAM protein [Bacteroidia bacterium]
MEHFYTLQGEGRFAGHAAYFIRLGGCDVGCVWCDVKESWNADNHASNSVNEMIDWVKESQAKICVITGGEPAMYDLSPIVKALKSIGVRSHIETSGAYHIKGDFDWICLSPKKFKFPIESSLIKANEYKVVVYHKSDIEWAMSYINLLNKDCILYLQPEWSKSESVLPLVIDFVKQNPHWQISLQTHKFLNIP